MSGHYFDWQGDCPFCEKETVHKCWTENHERDSSGDSRECVECGAHKSEVSSYWHKDGECRLDV